MVKEEAKMNVGQVVVKSVKKRRFLEYIGKVLVKDAIVQVIVTKESQSETWVR